MRHVARVPLASALLVVAALAGPPAVGDAAGAHPDFNGDGYADLASPAPGDLVSGAPAGGSVNVLYGSPTGPTAVGDQLWTQDVVGVPGETQSGAYFGRFLTWGDFDDDGYDDLAVSAAATVLGAQGAGSVTVLYGSAAGLSADGAQAWDRSSPGIPGEPFPAEMFAEDVASGDYDGDGYDDLAIGVPDAGPREKGQVVILHGSSAGLSAHRIQTWAPGAPGLAGPVQNSTKFGDVLASGDLNGDGRADLAVGSPTLTVDGLAKAGGFWLLYGAAGGLSATGSQFASEATPGVLGQPGADHWFALTLAVADVDADGIGDLLVCASRAETAVLHSGAALVLSGTSSGVDLFSGEHWHKDTPGVPGSDGAWIRLARATAGDFNGDGAADLAMGYFQADVGSANAAGVVVVVPGSATGLSTAGAQRWSQDSPGIAGTPEHSDFFGEAYALDANGDGYDDLAVGVLYEDVVGAANYWDGVVHVLLGGPSGLTATASQMWTPGADGLLGTPEGGGNFGYEFPYR